MGKNRSRANILQQLLLEHNFKNCQSLHGTSITYNVVHQLHFSFVLFFSFKKETRSGREQNNLQRERNNQVTKEKLLLVKFTPPSGYSGHLSLQEMGSKRKGALSFPCRNLKRARGGSMWVEGRLWRPGSAHIQHSCPGLGKSYRVSNTEWG